MAVGASIVSKGSSFGVSVFKIGGIMCSLMGSSPAEYNLIVESRVLIRVFLLASLKSSYSLWRLSKQRQEPDKIRRYMVKRCWKRWCFFFFVEKIVLRTLGKTHHFAWRTECGMR